MNSKALETPFDQFTEEELGAMGNDELIARTIYTTGDIAEVMIGMAGEAASEIAMAVAQSRALAQVIAEAQGEVADQLQAGLTPLLAEHIIACVLAAMTAARDIERFAAANPNYPDSDVVASFEAMVTGQVPDLTDDEVADLLTQDESEAHADA